MNPFDPPIFIECYVGNQLDSFSHARNLRSFIFRGHRVSSWNLTSSFEREFKKYPQSQMIEGAEAYSIEFFKKRSHLYDLGLNNSSVLPDVLSCMQHYGCPTRLIDFSESYYVATYFAVNDPNYNNDDYSIWAINFPALKAKSQEMAASYFGRHENDPSIQLRELIYNLLTIKPLGVVPVEAQAISRRMSSQRGVLLAQTNIRNSFIQNLCSMLDIGTTPEQVSFEDLRKVNQNIVNNIYVIKFNFDKKYIQQVRRELLSLNVTSENLFPDLNGLARSAVEHLFWQY